MKALKLREFMESKVFSLEIIIEEAGMYLDVRTPHDSIIGHRVLNQFGISKKQYKEIDTLFKSMDMQVTKILEKRE